MEIRWWAGNGITLVGFEWNYVGGLAVDLRWWAWGGLTLVGLGWN